MSEQAVLRARLFQGDLVVRFREFLEIIQVMHDRIVIVLGQSGFEEIQDDLGVFRIVLIQELCMASCVRAKASEEMSSR